MRTIHKRHRDPQRAFPTAECVFCGGELYRGDLYWRLAGQVLCEDCVALWLAGGAAACRLHLREVRR